MNLSSGYPYSLIKNGLQKSYPKLDSNKETEILILGGGISGALTAYYLTEANISCILIDSRTVGLGSSCASTSLLQYELDIPLHKLSNQIGKEKAERAYQLCSASIDTIEEISQKIGFTHFKRKPSLFFAATKRDKKMLFSEYSARKAAGFDVQYLEEKEIKDLAGFSASAGILSAQGASTDAYLLSHALLAYCVKKGLQVYDRTNAKEISYSKEKVEIKTDSKFKIRAKYMINATGYEVTHFIEKNIVQLNSTFACVSESFNSPEDLWKNDLLLWNTANPYLYMRLTEDNRILIGGRDETFVNIKKRDKLIPSKSQQLKKDFKKLFPAIPMEPEFSWTGTFGTTRDALPFIGPYAKTPNTFYALGFGGNGITFSVIAAQIICDLVQGKHNADAHLFAFDR